ncbi:hypothetical protein EIP86_010545 [Pleurotus ostreatoroseus]|nr:hypothetical protein EIP86_010545 [Pleurotus ostreatoroseus]
MAGRDAHGSYSPTSEVSDKSKDVSESWRGSWDDTEDEGEVPVVVAGGIGLLPNEVYDRQLHPLVAGIRKRILRNLSRESEVLAAMQRKVRTPFLDAYFVNTSSLGTHTFFMTLLPAFCFFGHPEIGRGLMFVLSLGVYTASVIKDMFCLPRPFAPPVTRLTIGSHHLEYGFPSTHSTNSVSIALFFFTIIHRLSKTPAAYTASPLSFAQNTTQIIEDVVPEMVVSSTMYWISAAVLLFYVFSIVYGRLYTAMHSFTDCTVGVLLGTAIWTVFVLYGDLVDRWLKTGGWIVPAVVIPFCLLCVHKHPEPVDDCPCFEDAIAFMSVVMGEFLTRWYMHQHGFDDGFFVRRMPGRPSGSLAEMCSWWTIAAAKLVVGVMAIFAWRILAKSLLHRVLPPAYRVLGQCMTLPHRRFYTPATDYTNVPFSPDLSSLRAIPSVLDLPGMVELEVDDVSVSTARRGRSKGVGREGDVKLRHAHGAQSHTHGMERDTKGKAVGFQVVHQDEGGIEERGGKEARVVKHYDADVVTKILVYSGIGALASGGMPIFFELIGWGIRS